MRTFEATAGIDLPLARQISYRPLNFSSAAIFKVLQCRSKLLKVLFECKTAWRRDETPSYSASHLDPSCLHMEK